MRFDFSVDGGEAMREYLERYRGVTERRGVQKAMEYAGDLIAQAAKRKVHVLGGETRENIGYRTTAGAKAIAVTVTSGKSRNAGPLEHGHAPSGWYTGDRPVLPQPFMWPAFEENKRDAYDVIKAAVAEAVRKP
jgi:HK97 gp10 family phage protein